MSSKKIMKKKIFLAITVVIAALFAVAIPASANNETGITNIGTTRKPIFTTERGEEAFCIQRDKKAPAATGTNYVCSKEEKYEGSLKNVLVNFALLESPSDDEKIIAQYAIWSEIEGAEAAESMRNVVSAYFGTAGVEIFDALRAEAPNLDLYVKEWVSDDAHQIMITYRSELVVESTIEPTTEPTTEPESVVEPTTEPTTEPESVVEPQFVTETLPVPVTITETSSEEEPTIKVLQFTEDEAEIPNTGVSEKILGASVTVLTLTIAVTIALKKKKGDC